MFKVCQIISVFSKMRPERKKFGNHCLRRNVKITSVHFQTFVRCIIKVFFRCLSRDSEKIHVLPNTSKILLCHCLTMKMFQFHNSNSVCRTILTMLLKYTCCFLLCVTFPVLDAVSRPTKGMFWSIIIGNILVLHKVMSCNTTTILLPRL